MDKSVSLEKALEFSRWVIAAVAAFLSGIPELVGLLVLLMIIDTLFGFEVARKNKSLSVQVAIEGASGKVYRLGAVAVFAIFQAYVQIPGIDLVLAATVFYIAPEILSIIKNLAILGVPVPPQIDRVLEYFADKGRSNENKRLP